MRILALNDSAMVGGAAQLFRRTNQLLRNAGHEVVEVTGDDLADKPPSPGRPRSLPGLVGHNVMVELRRVRASARRVYYPKLTAHLDGLISKHRFDVAHVHNIHTSLSTHVFPYLKSKGIPVVYQVNDHYYFCNTHWAYNRRLDQVCDRCIGGNALWALRNGCINDLGRATPISVAAEALGRYLVNATKRWSAIDLFIVTANKTADLLQRWGVDKERQHLLPNPMDLDDFQTPVTIGDEIVFYGTDLPVKGVGVFEAALESVNPGTRLGVYLAGMRPEFTKRLEEIGRRRGLEIRCDSSIRWRTGLKELLAKEARAIVVPTKWWVTSENVVYEGLLLGKPVITSNSGGNAERIDHGKTGFVFESGDPKQLAGYINQLAADRPLAEKMGKAAYHRARQEFSQDATLASLEIAYRKAQGFAASKEPALR